MALIVHNSPANVGEWPETVELRGVSFSDKGLAFDFHPPDRWDYHMPGWGDGQGDKGNILFTVWAVVEIGGNTHAAGFIQMWKGREATGAPLPQEWNTNWAYDKARWGEMVDYVPQPGSKMGFFLSAGNARGESAATSVAERTNVLYVDLPGAKSSPEPTPMPVPGPEPGQLDRIEAKVDILVNFVKGLK